MNNYSDLFSSDECIFPKKYIDKIADDVLKPSTQLPALDIICEPAPYEDTNEGKAAHEILAYLEKSSKAQETINRRNTLIAIITLIVAVATLIATIIGIVL